MKIFNLSRIIIILFIIFSFRLIEGTSQQEQDAIVINLSIPKKFFDEKEVHTDEFNKSCTRNIESLSNSLKYEDLRFPMVCLLSVALYSIRGEDSLHREALKNNNLFFVSPYTVCINNKTKKLQCNLKAENENVRFILQLISAK